jgi:hypothetical protein
MVRVMGREIRYLEVRKSKIFAQKCQMADGIYKSLFQVTVYSKCHNHKKKKLEALGKHK